MKKILFFAQNNGQVDNIRLLLDEFRNKNCEVTIFDTAQIYHQQIDYSSFNNIHKGNILLDMSFYRLSLIERIKSIWKSRHELRSIVNHFDMLIVASDGAFERVLINEFNKQEKKTVMLIDGIISDYSLPFKEILLHPKEIIAFTKSKALETFKKTIFNLFKTTPLSPFLPSSIGMMPLDKILVIGEHSKGCIEKINKKSKIIASGMPRLYGKKAQREKRNDSSIFYVCYFPSAFKWHHLMDDDKSQHEDILDVCKAINGIRADSGKDLRLVIKMHPRESYDGYQRYLNNYDFVSLVKDISVQECFNRFDLFLSNVSTVIVEGLIYGIRVYSLMINFKYWKVQKSFLSSNVIEKVYSYDELCSLIRSCTNKLYSCSISEIEKCDMFERDCSPTKVVKLILG